MIVGNGNIAKAILDRDDVTFFASGVSDSSCTDASQFQREIDLLIKQDRNKHLVYFSSLSIYRSDSAYNQHKKLMEDVVRSNFPYYTIFRVEVIEWGKNPTTIHNVFRKMIAQGEEPVIQDTLRYLITKDEFQYWLNLIPLFEKHEMNAPGQPHAIQDIYDRVKAGTL
jgi:hypothetical protein